MNRKSFFAAFVGSLGIGAAQQTFGGKLGPAGKILINGMCPTCGTQAEKILHHQQDNPTYYRCHDAPPGPSHVICFDKNTKEIPFETLVRCGNCSAAFYQDSEHDPALDRKSSQ